MKTETLSPQEKPEKARRLDAVTSPSLATWCVPSAESWAKTAIACLTRIREDSEFSQAERVSALAYVRDIADFHLCKVTQQTEGRR